MSSFRQAGNRATRLTFSIVDSATDAFIGEVGLHHVDAAARRAEVGYWLSPEARGRGAMQRALRLLLAWAFETLGLERVDWSAVADNAASRATAEAVGFRYEGLRPHRLLRTSDGTLARRDRHGPPAVRLGAIDAGC